MLYGKRIYYNYPKSYIHWREGTFTQIKSTKRKLIFVVCNRNEKRRITESCVFVICLQTIFMDFHSFVANFRLTAITFQQDRKKNVYVSLVFCRFTVYRIIFKLTRWPIESPVKRIIIYLLFFPIYERKFINISRVLPVQNGPMFVCLKTLLVSYVRANILFGVRVTLCTSITSRKLAKYRVSHGAETRVHGSHNSPHDRGHWHSIRPLSVLVN